MTAARLRLLKTVRSWLPCLLMGISLWVLGDAVSIVFADPPPMSKDAIEFAKERLQLYDGRARDIQWELGALMASGALFTLLQGIFAYFSVQNFNTQAEGALKKLDATRTALEEEFRKQLPLASKMEESIEKAVLLLDQYFEDADWQADLFDRLDANARQEVYFYEKVILSFASLDVPKLRLSIGRAFRGLGAFYASKYLSQGAGAGIAEDLERSHFYLKRAIKNNDKDFAALNLLAYFLLRLPPIGEADLNQAHAYLTSSLGANAEQQRGLYLMGAVRYHRKAYGEAIADYRTALKKDRWEFQTTTPVFCANLRFNLACCLAKQAEENAFRPSDYHQEILEMLLEALKASKQDLWDDFKVELKSGDLKWFHEQTKGFALWQPIFKASGYEEG